MPAGRCRCTRRIRACPRRIVAHEHERDIAAARPRRQRIGHRLRTRGHASYEKPLIPGLIFVRATKTQACALANEQGVPVRYLIDPATRSLLVVPDKQMDDFRRVLDLSTTEGGLMDRPLALGDRVRVTKGILRDVEGHVLELRGQTYVVVELLGCWFARASVPRAWLERIGGPSNATH